MQENEVLKEVKTVLNTMAIPVKDEELDKSLDKGFGMDSQEIVEMVTALEKRLGIKMGYVARGETIQELVENVCVSLDALQRMPKLFESYAFSMHEFVDIDIGGKDVYQAIYDYEVWPDHLPHVERIETIYDDGTYQEFKMDVLSKDDQLIKVRTVRVCDDGKTIRFFQPSPPKYMLSHCGGWLFQELKGGRCRLHTWHQWNIKPEVAMETFKGESNYEKHIEVIIRDHARLALNSWKANLEAQK